MRAIARRFTYTVVLALLADCRHSRAIALGNNHGFWLGLVGELKVVGRAHL